MCNMLERFYYDETGPLYALESDERDRAVQLNDKGFREGLTNEEFIELKTFFEKGVSILEGK